MVFNSHFNRSAARCEMATRGLYIFKHDSKLGNAPVHSLFERIQANLKPEVQVPRVFSDYAVTIQDNNLPSDIELITRV